MARLLSTGLTEWFGSRLPFGLVLYVGSLSRIGFLALYGSHYQCGFLVSFGSLNSSWVSPAKWLAPLSWFTLVPLARSNWLAFSCRMARFPHMEFSFLHGSREGFGLLAVYGSLYSTGLISISGSLRLVGLLKTVGSLTDAVFILHFGYAS